MNYLPITERLAYITALSADGGDCADVLRDAYCELMGGVSPFGGEAMAGVIVDTAARFSGWYDLAESSEADFASEYARSLGADCEADEREGRLRLFLQLLCRLYHGGREAAGLPDIPARELERLAAEALLAIPEPEFPSVDAADRRACAVLERRSGRHARSAWEALTLYTAAMALGRAPNATLEQYTAAACGRQAAQSAVCSGVLTAAQTKLRLRAAQLVTASLLAAMSPLMLKLLFAGEPDLAAEACRRALSDTEAMTSEINREAASMLEALDARAKPLMLKAKRRHPSALAESDSAEEAGLGAEAEAENERETLRSD